MKPMGRRGLGWFPGATRWHYHYRLGHGAQGFMLCGTGKALPIDGTTFSAYAPDLDKCSRCKALQAKVFPT